jgi:hypothetical protein
MKKRDFLLISIGIVLLASILGRAQVSIPTAASVQATQALYSMTPISATAAVGSSAVLTINAPPAGFFIYVCDLHLSVEQNASTPVAINNAATASTNFNSWATKVSLGTGNDAEVDQYWHWGTPAGGCAKSAAAGTATTFTAVTSTTSSSSWEGTYFIAP